MPEDKTSQETKNGYDAYLMSDGNETNPHPEGTPKHKDWLTGWNIAKEQFQPKIYTPCV